MENNTITERWWHACALINHCDKCPDREQCHLLIVQLQIESIK